MAEATPPAVSATPVMNERRVTVSPSKAPGQPRSAVNLDFGGLSASVEVFLVSVSGGIEKRIGIDQIKDGSVRTGRKHSQSGLPQFGCACAFIDCVSFRTTCDERGQGADRHGVALFSQRRETCGVHAVSRK
jgi:hypothetical protein